MLKYYLTDKSDEPKLRKLLRQTPMEGAYKVAFLCEPDYFAAASVQGQFVQTFAMRDTQKDEVVGMGTRAIKSCFVNGKPADIGYLSGLRGNPEYRKSMGLIRGYKVFHQYHNDNRAKLYLSTIIEDNHHARAILESGRCSMPVYHDIGRFCSKAIGLRQKVPLNFDNSISIKTLSHEDMPQVLEFMNIEGAKKQFFPHYRSSDFNSDQGVLRGLKSDDIFIAFSNNRILGIAATWDQREFKQSMIVGYKPLIKVIRPLINAGLGALRYPRLPKPGNKLNYFSLALVCIKDDSMNIFGALLNKIVNKNKGKYDFMMAGLHEKDPLARCLALYKGISYSSRLYVVYWPDGKSEFAKLDERVPYLELGAL